MEKAIRSLSLQIKREVELQMIVWVNPMLYETYRMSMRHSVGLEILPVLQELERELHLNE